MFTKTKARIAELEKTNDDFRVVVEHLKEHSEAYLAGAGCLIVGFFTGKHYQRPIEVHNTLAPTIIVETVAAP